MRVLVLGGTRFVGRFIVEAAIGQGHFVTTFNRGRTGSDAAGAVPCAATERTQRTWLAW